MPVTRIRDHLLRAALSLTGRLESRFLSRKKMKFPPLFIVGPPRSGTTLLGQVIDTGLDVAHIPTLAVRMSRNYSQRPPLVLISKLAKQFGRRKTGAANFESIYGASTSLGDASDSDPIWRIVLPDGFLDKGMLDQSTREYVYREFSGIERVFDRPLIDKSVGHSLRIPALLEIFPDALFVRCRRDVLAVAQSVWIGRANFPSTLWPTPKVRGYELLQHRPREEQAAGQQYLFEQDLNEGLAQVDPQRVIDVDYSDLCQSPKREISRIFDLMARNGVAVTKNRCLPDHFKNSRHRRIPMDTYESIIGHLERFWGRSIERLNEPPNDAK